MTRGVIVLAAGGILENRDLVIMNVLPALDLESAVPVTKGEPSRLLTTTPDDIRLLHNACTGPVCLAGLANHSPLLLSFPARQLVRLTG